VEAQAMLAKLSTSKDAEQQHSKGPSSADAGKQQEPATATPTAAPAPAALPPAASAPPAAAAPPAAPVVAPQPLPQSAPPAPPAVAPVPAAPVAAYAPAAPVPQQQQPAAGVPCAPPMAPPPQQQPQYGPPPPAPYGLPPGPPAPAPQAYQQPPPLPQQQQPASSSYMQVSTRIESPLGVSVVHYNHNMDWLELLGCAGQFLCQVGAFLQPWLSIKAALLYALPYCAILRAFTMMLSDVTHHLSLTPDREPPACLTVLLRRCHQGRHPLRCSSSSPCPHPRVQGPHPLQGTGLGPTIWAHHPLQQDPLQQTCMGPHQATCRCAACLVVWMPFISSFRAVMEV
jgi:hypothetical protein